MAITATIQHRRGNKKDFDASKMVPAELAMALDTRQVFAAFAPGDVKELASTEDVENLIGDFQSVVTEEIASAKKEIQNTGQEVLNSIPDDYEEVAKKTDEAVRTKADAIVCTASGNPARATDSSGDYIRALTLYGKTEQESTTGKNLLESTAVTKTVNGVTFTVNDDKSVTANGTATTNTFFGINGLFTFNANTEYILSGCPLGGSDRTYFMYVTDVTSNGNEYDIGNGASVIVEEETKKGVGICIFEGATVSNLTFYPMIRLASITDATYEPYTGGAASPSPEYPQELEDCGVYNDETGEYEITTAINTKNLAVNTRRESIESSSGVTYTPLKDGRYRLSGTGTMNSIFRLNQPDGSDFTAMPTLFTMQKGKRYAVIDCQIVATWDDGTAYNYGVTTENASPGIVKTYTPASSDWHVKAVRAFITKGVTYDSNNIYTPMVCLADGDYNYVEGVKQTIVTSVGNGLLGIPLGATIPDAIANSPAHMSGVWWDDETEQYYIGDTVDYESGVYVQRVYKDIADSTATITEYTIKATEGYKKYKIDTGFSFWKCINSDNVALGYCSAFNVVSIYPYITTGTEKTIGIAWSKTSGAYYSMVKEEDYPTVDDFAEYVANNPFEIMGVLATPLETDLPASEMEAYYALHSNYPVTQVGNDAGAYMQIKYNADTKLYIDNKFAELAAQLV